MFKCLLSLIFEDFRRKTITVLLLSLEVVRMVIRRKRLRDHRGFEGADKKSFQTKTKYQKDKTIFPK
jgi:hypothetical protein